MDDHPAIHVYLYGPDLGPIATSFEQAESRLSKLPRLHFEPDGSFVWAQQPGRQQVFGMIYDAHGSIQYCEIQGSCDQATWIQLCDAIKGDHDLSLTVLKLPQRERQDLQSFVTSNWPDSDSP